MNKVISGEFMNHKKITETSKLVEELNKEYEEFDVLMDEIKFDYDALAGDSTVTINGKAISNSQVAVSLAKNASRLSEVLYSLEEMED